MSFPRYPTYKPSGVEWLGEVPEHWEVLPLKRNARLLTDKTDNRSNPVALEHIVSWTGRLIETQTEFEGEGVSFEVGDILFGKLRPYLAKVYLATASGEAIGDFHVIHSRASLLPRLLQYQLLNREVIDLVNSSTCGAKMPRASWSFLGSIAMPVPPLQEQLPIASFLDHETAKIDALINEQQRLIELLQEKRQAVISHAVTKGLNPAAPMKDSGVEWLGEVPEHWGVTRLKHVTDLIVDCPHETPTYTEDGEFLVIRTADLDRGTLLNHSHMRRVDDFEYTNRIRRAPLERCDIVYGREGERWGHAALVPLSAKFCLGQRIMQFRCGPRWAPAFLMWLLNSRSVYLQGSLDTVGATSPHVNVGTIRNYALPEPPLDEQALIADSVATQAAHYDSLIHQCQQSSCLLSERRSALISAAVTGLIDVRGLVPEAVAA